MAVYNRISEFHDDMTRIRRDIHSHPETAFEEERTAKVCLLYTSDAADE